MKFLIQPPPVDDRCYYLDRKDLSDDAKIALLREIQVNMDPMDDDDDGEEEEDEDEETKKVLGDKKEEPGIVKRPPQAAPLEGEPVCKTPRIGEEPSHQSGEIPSGLMMQTGECN